MPDVFGGHGVKTGTPQGEAQWLAGRNFRQKVGGSCNGESFDLMLVLVRLEFGAANLLRFPERTASQSL